MRTAVIMLIAAGLTGCGGSGTAVSTTGSGVAPPDHAPQARAAGITRTASDEAIPKSSNPRERVLFLKGGSVWSMTATGDDAHQITLRAVSTPDLSPTLAARGGSFAFTSQRDGTSKLYVTDLATGVPRAITNGADGGDREPAWNPATGTLVFVRGDAAAGPLSLVEISADGTGSHLLLQIDDDNPEHAGMPAWSPNGRTLAFAADYRRNQGTLLWLVGADGANRQQLTPARQGAWFIRDRHPVWSPDGTTIAFASNRHVASADNAGDFDIYTIRADGTELTRLTEDPGVADEPAYSPDGKRLFFSSTRDTTNDYEVEIYVMPAGGGDQRRMTRDERPQNSSPSAGLTR